MTTRDELEPVSPELRALLDLERDAYDDAPALKAAVLRRVELAVGVAGGGNGGDSGGGGPAPIDAATASTVATGAATRTIVTVGLSAFALGGTAGVATTLAMHPRVVESPQIAIAATAPSQATAEARVEYPPVAASSLPYAPSAHVAASTAPATVAGTVSTASPGRELARERELVDVARAALGRDLAEEALAASRRHAERWPTGQLVEEREVIAIQALLKLGRVEEARRRVADFNRRFPSSLLRPKVDSLVSEKRDAGP